MDKNTPVLVLVNPYAGQWKTKRLWPGIEPMVLEALPNSRIVFSSSLDDFPHILKEAYRDGIRHVVTVGGDGTVHWAVNFMASEGLLSEFCVLPLQLGTGSDWSRSLKLPEKVDEHIHSWKDAHPVQVDLILSRADGRRYVVNVASLGISGEVVDEIAHQEKHPSWVYLVVTIKALFRYRAQPMRVVVDGEMWYEGRALILAVANGSAFGRGMIIAPNARVNDGLLDVVLIEDMPLAKAMISLPKLYSGGHLTLKETHYTRGKDIQVSSGGGSIKMEVDGEPDEVSSVEFTILPGAVKVCM